MSDAELGNQLVRQKNRIIDLINSGKIQEAKAALHVVQEMWAAADYSYKYKELISLSLLRDARHDNKQITTR